MEYQSVNGSFAPMSVKTLSFTRVQFLHIGLLVKTCWKSAIFRCEVKLDLYPPHYQRHSLFPASLTRWTIHSSYEKLTQHHIESPSGLPCSVCSTSDRLRVHLYSGGDIGSLLLTFGNQQPTHLPFGSGVSSSFHLLRFTKLEMIHISYPYRSPPGSYID